MLRHFLPVVASLMVVISQPVRLDAQSPESPQQRKAFHVALGGKWSGALRYRDYQDGTRFVSLPTMLQGTTAADSGSVRLDFVYDDGPGKTVRSSDTFALNSPTNALVWGPADGKRPPSTFDVKQISGGKTLSLVVEMNGEDDDRKARIRETLTVDAQELRILKEVKFTDNAPWLFRHEYRLRR